MLLTSNMPGCCGATVIHGFGNTMNAAGRTCKVSVDTIDKELQEVVVQHNTIPKAILIATLNEKQDRLLRKVMLKNKFHRGAGGYHPAHRNRVYIYTRTYRKNAKRPVIVYKESAPQTMDLPPYWYPNELEVTTT